ncbi:thioredoxin-like protein [Pseudovirgaria hyperparasitica]|uniref:Thioredoxin-like protein n=1 Tax=Pseudovirgaria hyperparasitica TaxID=470096 RepID=A0A6A6WJM9_9PEZI|nr:thioredoxin-like protein [Pseudovirgaria hyperparasitica]KAF2762037.1 thioredoxin-like protein [Pseudovirgaria hyperparasitica]
MAPITLYFLQASRSIRIAWLLEELKIPYETKFYWRENNKAPPTFKTESGSPLGKAPVIRDGDNIVYESGAIVEYLASKYDPDHRIIPANDDPKYPDVLQWIHAAEGQILLHALSITYATWMSPPAVKESGGFDKLLENLSINVVRDFDWLEGELGKNSGDFLVGNTVTGADIMTAFSARFVLTRELGTKGKTWSNVNKWLKKCESTKTYQDAVKKTGHSLDNGGNKPQ